MFYCFIFLKGDEDRLVDLRDSMGRSAMMLAASSGNTAIVRLLLDHGAQLDMQSNHGMTALMYTTKSKDTSVMEFLLERGAGLGLTSYSDGHTALSYAIENEQFGPIALLMKHKAESR